jgi:glutamate racemase
MQRIVVLISGRGSNLQALIDAVADGTLDARIAVVISNKASVAGLDRARTAGIDTLVLGCTHYPLLRAAIARALRHEITLVDSAENCATAVQETLDRQSLRSPATEHGELHVALTDAADNFLNVARDALQLSFGEIELRSLP